LQEAKVQTKSSNSLVLGKIPENKVNSKRKKKIKRVMAHQRRVRIKRRISRRKTRMVIEGKSSSKVH
jgi:hypothetical protein